MDRRSKRAMWRFLGLTLAAAVAACGGSDATTEQADSEGTEAAAVGVATATGSLLNPNLATEEQLRTVEGLPEAGVEAILANRPFLGMISLDAALAPHVGMGPRSDLYRRIWVPIDLNLASEDEILLIPGVGDRMAGEFEEYRPYDGMPRFRREMGKYVDEAQIDAWMPYVFLPVDLNAATDEEILAIPGVGDRLLGEFKEYRPYADMAEFRREIGKYVDEAELDRLARYVRVESE